MKRFFTIACTVLGTALLLASCQKVAEIVKPEEKKTEGEVYMTVTAKDGVNTRTHIDGTSVKWSASGEFLRVYEVATPNEGDPVTTAKESSAGVTEDDGETMTFGVSFIEKTGQQSFNYYAVYPSSAYKSGTSVTNINIDTQAEQTPVDGSFDPTADLLIAQKYEAGSSQPTSLDMHFGRAVAVGKITIKNLDTDDDVTKITFSAKLGEADIPLAGSTTFDITSSTLPATFANNTQKNAIILDCSELTDCDASGSDGMSAYFTCYPFTLNSDNPGTISVTVETATHRYTKEGIVVNSAKGLSLKAGYASKFGVDMDGIDGEAKEVDLRYAYLDYDDFTTAGGTTSYGNVTATKAHGDSWVMFAIATNNAIGVRRNDNGQNDSYIKLPDLAEDIKSVVVTLKNVTAGKTITLESSATASNGSIASQTTTDATVYTFDLTSTSVKTAYFRSNGFQAQVGKIEVYAGDDNRTAFNAPANVSAELNDDDDDVTNSIDVTWSSVDGAAGYIITLVPDSGDDVVVKAASSPCTVTDLAYEMDYLVSVQAEPADYYVNTISAQTTASDVVTTGAEPAGVVTLTDSDITAGDNTVKGTNNSKLAYRLGTGSNNGSITFEAGYSSITFTLAGWATGTRSFSITNGTINSSASLSPDAGAPSGNINAGFSTAYDGTEYTIDVTDSSQEVVFSGRRCVVWGFTAIEATPDTRADASLVWKKGGVEADSDTASIEDGDNVMPTIVLDNSVNSHPVTFSSSNTDVATIVESGVGAGTITLVDAGQTTISAIFAGDEDYKPLTVSYTLTVTDNRAVSYDFETVAELNALANPGGEKFGYLTGAVVSYVNGKSAFIKDATGSILLFKESHGLLQGQTFTGALTVTITEYNSCSELTACNASFTGSTSVVAPESVTLAQLVGHLDTYQNAYVKVDNLTVTEVNGKYITVTDDDGVSSYIVYSSAANATCSVGDVLSVKGTIAHYGENDQIKAWTTDDITVTASAPKAITFSQPAAGGSFTVSVGGSNITSGTTVASGTTVTLTATPATDYEFTSWNVTGATVASASSAETTFTMGTSAVNISASFSSTGGGGDQTQDYTVTWTATAAANLGSTISAVNGTASGTIAVAATGGTPSYNVSYTRTLISGTDYMGYGAAFGIQLGKNGGVENIEFRTSNIPGTIKSVTLNCSSYQSKHNVSITVGGNTYKSSTATASGQSPADITGTGDDSGEIVISVTGGTRYVCIKSITIVYNN